MARGGRVIGRMKALGRPRCKCTAARASAWPRRAAPEGQSSANEGKEHVAKHMTQSQVVKAQKLSREYWTRYVIPFQ